MLSFRDDLDRLLTEIKTDVRIIEEYIQDIDDDRVCIDTLTVEIIIQDLIDNANQLYVLTNPIY